jgi:hypothetical protein
MKLISVLRKTNLDIQLFISNDESTYNVTTLYFGLNRKGYKFKHASQFISSHDGKNGITYTFDKLTNAERSNGTKFNWSTPFIKNNTDIGMYNLEISTKQMDYISTSHTITLDKSINFCAFFPNLKNLNENLKDPFSLYNKNTPSKIISFTTQTNMHITDFFEFKENEDNKKQMRKRTLTRNYFENELIPDDKFFTTFCDKLIFFETYFYLLFPFMYLKLMSQPKSSIECLNLSLSTFLKLRSYSNYILNPTCDKLDNEKLIDLCSNFKRNNVITMAKAKTLSIHKDNDSILLNIFSKIPILKESFFNKFKYLNDGSFNFVAGLISKTDIYNAIEVEIAKNIFINI